MKKSLLLLCALFAASLQAQNFSIEWQNTIGGTLEDMAYVIEATSDGGYIVGGHSASSTSGDVTVGAYNNSRDYWILKLDAIGNVTWQKMVQAENNERVVSVHQTADGGYIVGGNSNSDYNASLDKSENSYGYDDYWVVKLDASGNIQWENTIGGDDFEFLYDVIQTADGGYLAAGSSLSGISGERTLPLIGFEDIWLVKLNAAGSVSWQKNYGGSQSERCQDVFQTADGGYMLGGSTNSPLSGDLWEPSNGGFDFWVVKLNDLGVIQWNVAVGGGGEDMLASLHETDDGNYIAAGTSNSGISGDKTEGNRGFDDYWMIKLSSNMGNIIWDKTVGGDDYDHLTEMIVTESGEYLLAGDSKSNISGDKTEPPRGNYDYWVVNVDDNGNIGWQRTIGGADEDYLKSITERARNNYVLAGFSESNSSGEKDENAIGDFDYWIVKLQCAQSTNTISETACNAYTSPSGNYTWTSSGTYNDTIPNAQGCDSVLTINLTVNTVDVSVIQADHVLQSNAVGGADYQWVDCDDNYAPIITEINQFFTATANGNYAVIVVQNGCVDTSACYAVTSIGIDESALANKVNLYPNPNTGSFIVDLGRQYNQLQILISDATGRLVYSAGNPKTDQLVMNLDLPQGVYFIRLVADGEEAVLKWIMK